MKTSFVLAFPYSRECFPSVEKAQSLHNLVYFMLVLIVRKVLVSPRAQAHFQVVLTAVVQVLGSVSRFISGMRDSKEVCVRVYI